MVDIAQKIAEIRRQPEHIRMRWVYGSVAACMAFVLLVWIMSTRVDFANKVSTGDPALEALGDFFEQEPTLDDLKTQ